MMDGGTLTMGEVMYNAFEPHDRNDNCADLAGDVKQCIYENCEDV
jgi:hypothetical protein